MAFWSDNTSFVPLIEPISHKQRAWGGVDCWLYSGISFFLAVSLLDQARFLAAGMTHSGDWLNAIPIQFCELLLKISEEEVEAAIGKMKLGKAWGPSGVVADMLKAACDEGTRWMTELCNAVVRGGKIPKDWSRSWLVNVYNWEGDALACGSYRGIKLVEHVMKVLERVIERRIRNIVKIDSMQFGFMAGKSAADAIFIVRQLQEKYLARNKKL